MSLSARNLGISPVSLNITGRLYLASSSTALLLDAFFWKRLEVLPGQCVRKSAVVRFPAVRGWTRFLVQWVDDRQEVLGVSELQVCPSGLLAELNRLSGRDPVEVLDPEGSLKSALRRARVRFVDLDALGLERASGRLVVIGPLPTERERSPGVLEQVRRLAGQGGALVWFQTATQGSPRFLPGFWSVPVGNGTVLVAHPALIADLARRPEAQQNLLELARLAVRPLSPTLLAPANNAPDDL